MEIASRPHEFNLGDEGCVATIGVYDGVHLGHRALLGGVQSHARQLGLTTTVVTFDRHPAQVVRPESAPLLLCDLEQKLELLASTGVERALVVEFDEARAAETAEHFVLDTLVDGLGAKVVAVGEDFHFGHGRQGNVELLTNMGAEHGFVTVGQPLVGPDGNVARPEEQVSSTAIRRALVSGRLDEANLMLGRSHVMVGPVVEGDRRGRLIGFPTANVAVGAEMLLPADGIYAGALTRADGTVLDAAIYLGKRPTFYDNQPASLLEVHCLDFDGDLYGERVEVRFDHHLRGEKKFESVDELAAQLQLDCDAARQVLAQRG